MATTTKTWQEIAAEARSHRDTTIADPLIQPPIPHVPTELPLDVTQIPKALLTPDEIRITELLPEQLLPLLASGTLSSTTVTKAFLRRAGLAHRLTNCLTELLPKRALDRAAELDEYLKTHGKPMGPLHGLPISVKEHISFADLGLNFGYVSHYYDKGVVDAHPLRILAAAGPVFYVRTTEPQTIMHLECSSNLYGTTVNPFNTALSSGGSSGGEGALIGMRGSCLGIGTDIGGSIRSPAGNCGVYGLRPTAKRLPYEGVESTAVGTGGIIPVQGPLSTSLYGIKTYAKVLLDGKPWIEEDSLLPLPWKEVPKIKKGDKLKVGVMWDDGDVRPHPPVSRAMQEVVEKLKAVPGIEVIEFPAYKHDVGWDIISSLYFPDGGRGEAKEINASGEPYRPLTKWLLEEEGHVKRLEVESLWDWQIKREEYMAEYNNHWLATGNGNHEEAMDVLLCPYFPSASSTLNNAKYWHYTSTWNVLDYPSLVFPVSRVDPVIDKADEEFKARSEKDDWNHKQCELRFLENITC